MPLLSSKLPSYSGEYEVGTIDIEAPCEKRNISDVVFKESGQPAFELETVLFSVYYPAVKAWRTEKAPHPWVDNTAQHGEGYARFAHVNSGFTNGVFSSALWALVGSTTIPAHVDIPLYGSKDMAEDYETEQPLEDHDLPKFPVIVFSHGMASSRTDYTHYCGELASRGFIVAAIEHRDGSGPASSVTREDGTTRDVFHIGQDQLEPRPDDDEFKTMQRAMRQAEIEETVRVLRLINDGLGGEIFKANPRNEGEGLAEWQGRINVDRFVIGGHSFGATEALQVLKGAPCEARPFVGGIVLDPGKQSGSLNDDVKVPILVVHSQSWSAKHSMFNGRPHFEVVKELVEKVMRKDERSDNPGHGAWFLTSKGTTHPSVTDAPLIEPFLLSWTTGSTIDAREGVMQYVKVSDEFMQYMDDGRRVGVLAEDVTHPAYNEDTRTEKRKKEMSKEVAKYWQIHVSPSKP